MQDTSKMSKEEYVKYMRSLVDEKKVKETWSQFKEKFVKENNREPDYWIDFMELDEADMSDMIILSSIDENFDEFVYKNPTVLNGEVINKTKRKINSKIPDSMQMDVEGEPGIGKSTFMLAVNYEMFYNFNANDVFYLKKDLIDFISKYPDISRGTVKVLDEDVKSKGIGSKRVEDDLTQLYESCRKARLSYCGCHAIAKHENQTVYYRFLVFAKNVERRITCASVYRKNTCIGFVQWGIPYSEKFFELEYEYNKKKDNFIDDTLRNDNRETLDIDKLAKEILELPEIKLMIESGKINKKMLKTSVYEKFNNFTKDEQELITTKANILVLTKQVEEEKEQEKTKGEKHSKTTK